MDRRTELTAGERHICLWLVVMALVASDWSNIWISLFSHIAGFGAVCVYAFMPQFDAWLRRRMTPR